jgi:hypothetical protein
LPEGNEPPPGSSNSSHRKELEADSLEARAKAFELKRYVSDFHSTARLSTFKPLQESCYTAMIGKSALRSMPSSSGMANILGDADLKVPLPTFSPQPSTSS